MAILSPSLAERNREANAINITAKHLADRTARTISARRLSTGLLVWKVQSQTSDDVYTVTRIVDGWEADTCSCADCVYRHQRCKHLRSVDLIAPPPADRRGPAWSDQTFAAGEDSDWAPVGGWLRDQRRRRSEPTEELDW